MLDVTTFHMTIGFQFDLTFHSDLTTIPIHGNNYRVYRGLLAKNLIQLPELCRSSLRRGHANLLCIYILFIDGTARGRATNYISSTITENQGNTHLCYGQPAQHRTR